MQSNDAPNSSKPRAVIPSAAIGPTQATDQSKHSVPLPPPVTGLSLRNTAATANSATIEATTAAKPPIKLRLKLAVQTFLSATLIGAIPLLGIGAAGYAWMNQTATAGLRQQQQTTAIQLAHQLDQFLRERVQDLAPLTTLNWLQDKPLTATDKQQLLEQLKRHESSFQHIAVFNRDGQAIVQTRGINLPNQLQQRHFQQVLQTKSSVIAAVPTANAGVTIMMAIPLQQPQQSQISGVILAQLRPEALEGLLLSNINQDQAYITDGQGKILFASAAPSSEPQTLDPIVPYLPAERPTGSAVSQPLQWGLSPFNPLPGATSDYLLGWAAMPTNETFSTLPWQTIVTADVPAIVQQQRDQARQLGLALLVGLGVAGLVGLLIGRRRNRLTSEQLHQLETQCRSLKQQQQLNTEHSQWLGQMIETMRQSMGEAALLNTTVTELRYALQADRVMFYRCNDDWSATIIAESVGANYRQFMGQTIHDLFCESTVAQYQDAQVQVIPDIARLDLTGAQRANLTKFQIKASLIAPILRHGKLVGLLCAHQCAHTRQWAPEEVDIFAKLAAQLGFVLEQAALIQRQAKSVEKSRILNEIVDSMRRSFQEEDILNTTVHELRYTLNADRVVVYRIDRNQRAVIQAESVGVSFRKLRGRILEQPFPEHIMERFRMGQVWCMPDIDAERLLPDFRAMLAEFQVRSSIVAAVIQEGDLVGLLAVHASNEPRHWEQEDIGLVARLGSQLGLALNQATILRRQTLSAERLKTLNEIVSVMRRSLHETDILHTAVQELRVILGVDRVLVYRFDQPQVRRASEHDIAPNQTGQVIAEATALSTERLTGREIIELFATLPPPQLKHGHVQSLTNIPQAGLSEPHRQLLEDLQIQASIVAPILQNGELTGLLCAHSHDVRYWETEDLDLFAKLAIQLGYALDQATLIAATESERAAARAAADSTIIAQQQQQQHFQQRTQELLHQVAPLIRGDLTIQARESNDEVGTIAKSYNAAIETLRKTITQVQCASRSVARTASDSEEAVSSLSADSRQQIQAVNQAIEHVQAMMYALQDIAARAAGAENQVQLATQKLRMSDTHMDRTTLSLSSMDETVSVTAKKVKRLGEVSQKIARVGTLINGFATQSNLLAMNASIEAAKAGENGQGFVVVAEEVRALAQQSATATTEIEQIVDDIQHQTNDLIAAIEAGSTHMVHGLQQVEASRQQLHEINAVSMQLNQAVQAIAQVANHQTDSAPAVTQTLQQVATIADSTSHQTQTVAASFAQLLELTENLQMSAEQFKVRPGQ